MGTRNHALAEAPSAREGLLAAFKGTMSTGPEWVRALRREAWERFDTLGFPGPKNEEWRQTPVASIAEKAFTAAESRDLPSHECLPRSSGGPRLVLVNGIPSPSLSNLDSLPKGVTVRTFSEAWESESDMGTTLGAVAPWRDRTFAALNTASFREGVLVEAGKGVAAGRPVEIVHVALPSTDSPVAIHPRVLVRAGDQAELNVVEWFVCAGKAPYWNNAVTEVVVGENAFVEHVRIQDDAETGFHVASVDAVQAANSRFRSHNVAFGSALARTDIGSRLNGPGAEAFLYGLTVTGKRSHVDHHTALDHAVPHCPSHELYKSILWDRARYVFNGRIIVRPDAQKTDAKQSNRNLLLSDDAVVFTRPQLEIYADDVKCTHGATIGRLDRDALFYLRARGLGPVEARALLIRAFTGEVLEHLSDSRLREQLEEEAVRRIPALR